MKFDEYKVAIDGLLLKPDTALAEIGGVYEKLKADLTTLDSLTTENIGLKEKIKELQDTNIKLYMSQGVEAKKETIGEPEVDPETEEVENFMTELQGGE